MKIKVGNLIFDNLSDSLGYVMKIVPEDDMILIHWAHARITRQQPEWNIFSWVQREVDDESMKLFK